MIIDVIRHGDHRGFFSETYNKRVFFAAGIAVDFIQDNHSRSAEKGTIRGLHYQEPPYAQHKLIRVLRGAILDVTVDIRRSSSAYGRHVAIRIDAEAGRQILVPIGFAHGFCTLEPNTEVLYKVSNYYAPAADKGIRWNDTALGIVWPVAEPEATLSDRDRRLPLLSEIASPF